MIGLLEKNLIEYIDIGIDAASKLIRWQSSSSNVGGIDIMSARASAQNNYYKRIEKYNARTIFTKKNNYVFIISAKENIQYQLLEAILDGIMVDFFNIYGENSGSDFISGMASMFDGFTSKIPNLIKKIEKENVVWVHSHCKLCQKSHKVCVKRSLIENSEFFPVSLVYYHQGHGVLLHIDANFKVRGTEIVHISG